MDLGGPKLRTGAIDPASQTLRWKPRRSEQGTVAEPARIWLTAVEKPRPAPAPADAILLVPRRWLRVAQSGERLRFVDLRGKLRSVALDDAAPGGRWADGPNTVYVNEAQPLALQHERKHGTRAAAAVTEAIPRALSDERHAITLRTGDVLVLTAAPLPGSPSLRDARGRVLRPASISCTLPEVFADLRAGERISFDDGRIGGTIESVRRGALRVRITAAAEGGAKLRADKGINLPDSDLRTPALTAKDLADLDFVARHADLVGLSFVRTPRDVHELRRQLARRRASSRAIVLKIETRAAFEHLPGLLLAAMQSERVAVMIARGDLAVECGYERLAEVQEEMLWFCEAAHVPVIWATQVLESLAKSGVPSRAEITDAAMGERAECVMLNKGPHLDDAVRVLRSILQRMDAHQHKKSARLRRLRLSSIATKA
jgi:pyruvate kinase